MNYKRILLILTIVIITICAISSINAAKIESDPSYYRYHVGYQHRYITDTQANCHWGNHGGKCHYYGKTTIGYYPPKGTKYVKIKIGKKTIKRSYYTFYAYPGNLKGKTVKIAAYNKYDKKIASKTIKVKNVSTKLAYWA